MRREGAWQSGIDIQWPGMRMCWIFQVKLMNDSAGPSSLGMIPIMGMIPCLCFVALFLTIKSLAQRLQRASLRGSLWTLHLRIYAKWKYSIWAKSWCHITRNCKVDRTAAAGNSFVQSRIFWSNKHNCPEWSAIYQSQSSVKLISGHIRD